MRTPGATCGKLGVIGLCSREGATIATALRIWPPEQDTDVDPTSGGPIQHVEERTSAVREMEIESEESDGQPDAVPRGFDGVTDAFERRGAVDERPNKIARSNGVRAVCHGRNVRAVSGGQDLTGLAHRRTAITMRSAYPKSTLIRPRRSKSEADPRFRNLHFLGGVP